MFFPENSLALPLAGLIAAALFIDGVLNTSTSAEVRPAKTDTAVLTIPAPREGSLLQLRGLAGRGTIVLRIDGTCHSIATRFVAGDFDGARIDTDRVGPIRMRITDPTTIKALRDGHDIVSDQVSVADSEAGAQADIILLQGLTSETGFVINPGRSILADVTRPKLRRVSCEALNSRS